jgi:DNA modification methylase
MTPRNLVLEGDALSVLGRLADASVDCVVMSPPYFQARHYDAGHGELGQERDVNEWVAAIRALRSACVPPNTLIKRGTSRDN